MTTQRKKRGLDATDKAALVLLFVVIPILFSAIGIVTYFSYAINL